VNSRRTRQLRGRFDQPDQVCLVLPREGDAKATQTPSQTPILLHPNMALFTCRGDITAGRSEMEFSVEGLGGILWDPVDTLGIVVLNGP